MITPLGRAPAWLQLDHCRRDMAEPGWPIRRKQQAHSHTM